MVGEFPKITRQWESERSRRVAATDLRRSPAVVRQIDRESTHKAVAKVWRIRNTAISDRSWPHPIFPSLEMTARSAGAKDMTREPSVPEEYRTNTSNALPSERDSLGLIIRQAR